MDKKAIITLVSAGLLTTGLIVGGMVIYKKKVTDNTDPAKANTYEGKTLALLNKVNALSQEERNALMKTKMTTGEMTRTIYLMNQFAKSRSSMTDTEMEELYRNLNNVFGA